MLTCPDCGRALVVGCGGGITTYAHPSNVACRASGSISAEAAERAVLAAVGKAIRDLEGRSAAALGNLPVELERAEERIAKLRRVAALTDDEEGFAVEYRRLTEARDELRRQIADAEAVDSATWRLSGYLDDEGRDTPDFDGLGREALRDVISTVVERAVVERRNGHARAEDRVRIEVRETFDVSRLLDGAAAGLAEVRTLAV
jgi:hypothetical protein